VNLKRLNHILIPRTKAERDRYRRSRTARLLYRLFAWLFLLSDEGRGALLLWLLASAVSINVGTTQFYYLSSALTGLIGISLIAARWYRLKATRLETRAPRRTIVDETVTFSLALENRGDDTHQSVRIGMPFLPWDGQWLERPSPVKNLGPKERVHLTAKARFLARGEHHLDPFRANQLVPLGLANGPGLESQGVRFLVVPRIANVEGFEMQLSERYQPGGVALASRTGESRELVGLRPYQGGDPIRDLHASTWARTGIPHVREYQQEYFTRVGVVVDTDQTRTTEAAFEAALSLAAGVLSHLGRGEALIDLLVLGDDVHTLVMGRNLGFLDQALDLLACVSPGEPLAADALQSRVDPYIDRLSSMIYIALDWDVARQRFSRWVKSRGIGCRVIRVAHKRDDAESPNGLDLSTLTVSEIENGEALWL
jgi:uncharacterized protein (DUF58 family)